MIAPSVPIEMPEAILHPDDAPEALAAPAVEMLAEAAATPAPASLEIPMDIARRGAEGLEAAADVIEAAVAFGDEMVTAPVEASLGLVEAVRVEAVRAEAVRAKAVRAEAVVDPSPEPIAAVPAAMSRPARRRKVYKPRAGTAQPSLKNAAAGAAKKGASAAAGSRDIAAMSLPTVLVAERVTKLLGEAREATTSNVQALVTSSEIAVMGIGAIGQGAADYGRKNLEEASNAWRKLATVGSLADLFKLQSDQACLSFASFFAESKRLSEAVLKLSEEVAGPITRRYSVAVEQVRHFGL
ncbi:MAG: phasin [Alphaproteobacteria bacterium]|nr:phasin [Alphaproteobacteria bacterium]